MTTRLEFLKSPSTTHLPLRLHRMVYQNFFKATQISLFMASPNSSYAHAFTSAIAFAAALPGFPQPSIESGEPSVTPRLP